MTGAVNETRLVAGPTIGGTKVTGAVSWCAADRVGQQITQRLQAIWHGPSPSCEAVLATGRPGSAATARLAAGRRDDERWLLISLDPDRLLLAVLAGSGAAGCPRCLAGSHPLDAFLDEHPEAVADSYLPVQLGIAAQAGVTALAELAAGHRPGGYPVRTLELAENALHSRPAPTGACPHRPAERPALLDPSGG